MTLNATKLLLLSDCYWQLYLSMWGAVPQSQAVQNEKELYRTSCGTTEHFSVGDGNWWKAVYQSLNDAIGRGSLDLHVSLDCTFRLDQLELHKPTIISGSSIIAFALGESGARFLMKGGGLNLPDRGNRLLANRKTSARYIPEQQYAELRYLVEHGSLHVCADQFDDWLSIERSKGKWPSQTKRKKPVIGRPSVINDDVENEIIAIANEGEWSGGDGISALKRMLEGRLGSDKVGSVATLRRFLHKLATELGRPDLRPKRNRKRSSH